MDIIYIQDFTENVNITITMDALKTMTKPLKSLSWGIATRSWGCHQALLALDGPEVVMWSLMLKVTTDCYLSSKVKKKIVLDHNY